MLLLEGPAMLLLEGPAMLLLDGPARLLEEGPAMILLEGPARSSSGGALGVVDRLSRLMPATGGSHMALRSTFT
jgi:hypothetical protein